MANKAYFLDQLATTLEAYARDQTWQPPLPLGHDGLSHLAQISKVLADAVFANGKLLPGAQLSLALVRTFQGGKALSNDLKRFLQSADLVLWYARLLRLMIARDIGSKEVSDCLASCPASPQNKERAYLRAVLPLLGYTLQRAMSCTTRYKGFTKLGEIPALEAFQKWPILTRADVEADFQSICANHVTPDYYTATSATTTGRSLLIPHTQNEMHQLVQFSHALRQGGDDDHCGDHKAQKETDIFGSTLRLMPSGRLIGAPTMGGGNTVLATYDTNAVKENIWDTWDYIIGQVFAEFPSAHGANKIKTIHSTPAFGLSLLTKYMVQRGLPPADSDVRNLLITGSWVGTKTRKWLEKTWYAKLHTTYSCAEMVGAAYECPFRANHYHYAAHIIPECVDLKGTPAAVGEQGRLLVTGNYPFHQAAHFIRYEIGDWVRWLGYGECLCGAVSGSFEMLGRTGDMVFLSAAGRKIPLPPLPFREALNQFSCIPQIPRPQYRVEVKAKGKLQIVTLHVECFALGGAAWQQKTRDEICASVLKILPELAECVETGRVELQVELYYRSRLSTSVKVI